MISRKIRKTILDAQRVKVSHPISIGGSNRGSVYIGRLHFKDGTKPRVAIKLFHNGLSTETARKYQKVIDDLTKAGVPLPKMGMMLIRAGTKIGDHIIPTREWVQVSQLFGSSKKGSKLVWKSHLELTHKEEKRDAAKMFGKVANLGYSPTIDFVEPFRYKKGVVPIDIDLLVERREYSAQEKMGTLSTTIRRMSNTKEDFRELSIIALRQLSPEKRKLAREKFQERLQNWDREKFMSKSVRLN